MPDRTPRPPVPQAVVMIDRPLVMAARLEQRSAMGIGQGMAGQDRTGQDRTGQDRTGQDRMEWNPWVAAVYCLLT
jgi:hypothetical protein